MAESFADLRQVGEISSVTSRRRIQRQPKNPMDVCTVVSIFPKAIHEVKPTIEPGVFNIPAGTFESPSVLHVGMSSWLRDSDLDQPILEIPCGSIQVAESLVRDYCNAMLGCDMVNRMPGLFYVPGRKTSKEIKTEYKDKLEKVNTTQRNWFEALKRLADSLWARSNGNPLTISDDMRLAAKELGYDAPWMKDFTTATLAKCIACGGLRDVKYPVCPSCKFIDPAHPLAKEMQFAVS